MDKHYISAEALLQDSFRLGLEVYNSGFRPDFIVGVWRGGTPVGIAVQEILGYCGHDCDHIAIRTASYTGIGTRDREVRVFGLSYLVERMQPDSRLLLVDDVYDTGLSVQAVVQRLRHLCSDKPTVDIRIATPWFKPGNNQTPVNPDYYLHETDQWLVFPHEIDGLDRTELARNKPGLAALLEEYGH